MSNRLLPTLALVIGTVAALVLLQRCAPEVAKDSKSEVTAIPVEAVIARPSDFPVTITSQGLVTAKTKATLTAQVAGNVIAVSPQFERGGEFAAGDRLLTIDDRDYLANVKLAEANVQKARVEVQQEQARVEQALRDWNRLDQTGEPPSDLVLRKPQLAAAQGQLASMEAQLSKTQLDLERTRITAPFAGRVVAQHADLGDFVNRGTALADIVGTEWLEVSLPISPRWREFLPGDNGPTSNVSVSLKLNNKNVSWPGRIINRSADLDNNTRQMSLIAAIDPKAGSDKTLQLMVGDYVTAQIQGKTLSQVFVLPRAALIEDNQLWVVQQQRLFKRAVNVLWRDQNHVVINDGLQTGDVVNITPLGHMISGTLVEVVPAEKHRQAGPGEQS